MLPAVNGAVPAQICASAVVATPATSAVTRRNFLVILFRSRKLRGGGTCYPKRTPYPAESHAGGRQKRSKGPRRGTGTSENRRRAPEGDARRRTTTSMDLSLATATLLCHTARATKVVRQAEAERRLSA